MRKFEFAAHKMFQADEKNSFLLALREKKFPLSS